jgi:hypothetical protein
MHQTISDLAYALWQARGCPDGTADSDWVEAERQFMSTRNASSTTDGGSQDSFPASDPPANQLSDKPPVDMEKKSVPAKATRSKKKAPKRNSAE